MGIQLQRWAAFGCLLSAALSSTALVGTSTLEAADLYRVVTADELKVDRPLPTKHKWVWTGGQLWAVTKPYAVLDGRGEVYLDSKFTFSNSSKTRIGVFFADADVPKGDITGSLYWPNADGKGMQRYRFSISAAPPETRQADVRRQFLTIKLGHFDALLAADIPGAAWFRHQARLVRSELKLPSSAPRRTRVFMQRTSSVEETFALMSGGQALSENLQLDRQLPPSAAGETTVPLSSIPGITIQEFDWKSLVKDIQPSLDPLASRIPDDQYALFFSSFDALVSLVDRADSYAGPLLAWIEPRAEQADVQRRYEKQLGLSLGRAARLFGSSLISGVALTGGDPYFRTGTDVAVLFEAKNPQVLRGFVETQIAAATAGDKTVKTMQGLAGNIPYQARVNDDRSVSSYVATLGTSVVVTNSLQQLQRLAEVHGKKRSPLSELDEYRYFRNRYRLKEGRPTAFIVISDKTIRRWCGPASRIGSSRRTRAMATVAELQASHLKELVQQTAKTGSLGIGSSLPAAGDLQLTSSGVRSQPYGSLAFQTPLLEMEIPHATRREADLYGRWRQGYERNWSNFFDPIAIQVEVTPDMVDVDMTVMPLIDGSRYREMVNVSQGAQLKPNSGDPHAEVLGHWILALNRQSPVLKQNLQLLRNIAPQIQVDPLSWMGDFVSVYVDDDPLWKELSKLKGDAAIEQFMEKEIHRLPLALHVDVKSGLKLTLFLAGMRSFLDQTAPGMTVWETRTHAGSSYVRISPSATARSQTPDSFDKVALHYAVSGESLIVTLSEDLLKRALQRRSDRAAGKSDGKSDGKSKDSASQNKPELAWLGKNMNLVVHNKAVRLLERLGQDSFQRRMQQLSWANLPILNAWKRQFPDQDPLKVHQEYWHRKLVCPGGGTYRWNEEFQTMESSVFGHPAAGVASAKLPDSIARIHSANFGIDFEEHGLRTHFQLRQTNKP